ncbi:hypothetical protein AVEN_242892-1, partial [Araneus ventricosus]
GKYKAAVFTVDPSRLPNKNSFIQQAKIIMIRLFCKEVELLSNTSRSEEESMETWEDKSLKHCTKNWKKQSTQRQRSYIDQLARVLA